MSFFNCANQENCMNTPNQAGQNSVEKICVEVKRVFDACMKQGTAEKVPVRLYDTVPSNPCYPLKFCSAATLNPVGNLINSTITPICDRPGYVRVQGCVEAELNICFIDANNEKGTGKGKVLIPIDIMLCVPKPSMVPYELKFVLGMVCPSGCYQDHNCFLLTCCYTLISKVVMDVELVIPTYGYCTLPPCQEFSEEICEDYFQLPIYPDVSKNCCK